MTNTCYQADWRKLVINFFTFYVRPSEQMGDATIGDVVLARKLRAFCVERAAVPWP